MAPYDSSICCEASIKSKELGAELVPTCTAGSVCTKDSMSPSYLISTNPGSTEIDSGLIEGCHCGSESEEPETPSLLHDNAAIAALPLRLGDIFPETLHLVFDHLSAEEFRHQNQVEGYEGGERAQGDEISRAISSDPLHSSQTCEITQDPPDASYFESSGRSLSPDNGNFSRDIPNQEQYLSSERSESDGELSPEPVTERWTESSEYEDESTGSDSTISDYSGEDPTHDGLTDVSDMPTDVSYLSIEEAAKSSPTAKEWYNMRLESGIKSDTLDEIMMVFGHENVKEHCLSIVEKPHTIRSAFFAGNEGLGIENLAKMYAKLLGELTRRKLSTKNLHSSLDIKRIIGRTRGRKRVIQINNVSLDGLNLLFDDSNKLDARTLVVAHKTWSNADEAGAFETAFSKARPTSHLFLLQDYTHDQLRKALFLAARQSHAEFEGGADNPDIGKVVELTSFNRGNPGYRNSLAVLKGLEVMISNAKRRTKRRSTRSIVLTKADMLGETTAELEERISAWHKMRAMLGLDQIKETIRLYFRQVQYRHCCALQGRDLPDVVLNRLFLGPSGTGKTTVAKLLAEILSELGLVSNGRVIVQQPTTLIQGWVGHSERKTRRVIRKALGGVLIIDEAHTFLSSKRDGKIDGFHSGIIDTLVGQYQKHQRRGGRKRVTIFFVGQKESTVELLETSNPGLARILPLEEAFHLPTYPDSILKEMLHQGIEAVGLRASDKALEVAQGILSLAKHRPTFTNAAAVTAMLGTATLRHQTRILSAMEINQALTEPLQPEDFDPNWDRIQLASERTVQLFANLQGMDYIMSQFQGYQELVVQFRDKGLDPRPYVPLSFVFKGPPGTGKTTVARKMAQIYYEMGLLSAPEVVECSVTQLVSTDKSTRAGVEGMFERALGKVLFIDEAYVLLHIGGPGAIGALVDCMTKERFIQKLVVVLAGYNDDMDRLLDENRGLRSRFPTVLTFQPMKPTDALDLLKRLVEVVGLRITGLEPGDITRQQSVRFLNRLSSTKSWANAREIETLSRVLIQEAFRKSTSQQRNGAHTTDTTASTDGVQLVQATNVIFCLANHLSKAMEMEEKNAASEQQVAGGDDRSRQRHRHK